MKYDLTFYKAVAEYIDSKWRLKTPIWRDLCRFLGLKSNLFNVAVMGGKANIEQQKLDEKIFDETPALMSRKSAEYYQGLMFPNKNPVFISPLATIADEEGVTDFAYAFHAGLMEYLKSFRCGFGDSSGKFFNEYTGLGNALMLVREGDSADEPFNVYAYGLDSFGLKNNALGQPEIALIRQQYDILSFMQAFGDTAPQDVRSKYEAAQLSAEVEVSHLILPNPEYNAKGIGKASEAKYMGVYWAQDQILATEYYWENPFVCGQFGKVQGEIYGRGANEMCYKTIKAANGYMYLSMVNTAKRTDPAVGVWDGSASGDGEFDTSAGALVTFNPTLLQGKEPVFQIQDIGDISAVISFMLPHLHDVLNEAHKNDLLSQFQSGANKTRLEVMTLNDIRNQGMNGIVTNLWAQLQGFWHRVIACYYRQVWKGKEGVPAAIRKLADKGEQWYVLQPNTALQQVLNAQEFDNYNTAVNTVMGSATVDPVIGQIANFYPALKNLLDGNGYGTMLPSVVQYSIAKQQFNAMQQQQAQTEMAYKQSQANANNAKATGENGNGII